MSHLNKLLLFSIAALIVAGQFVPFPVQSNEKSQIIPSPTVMLSPTPVPIAAPAVLSIPKIGVQASVESVSVDFDGRMNMPEDYAKVAWYSPGFKPGEQGNAVIAGHLDTTAGTPALFYTLHTLEPGDEMTVLASDSKLYTFVVYRKETFEFNKAPIDEIFGPSSDKYLNLMTCTGWWNPATHNYSHRVVVFTRLKEQ